MVLLARAHGGVRPWAVAWGSGLAVLGLVLHRANVGALAQISEVGFGYVPTLTEISVTLGVVGALGLTFLFFAEHLKLWDELPAADHHFAPSARDPLTGVFLNGPWLSGFRRALAAAVVGLVAGLALVEWTVPRRSAPVPWPVPAPQQVALVRVASVPPAGAPPVPGRLYLARQAEWSSQEIPLPVAAVRETTAGPLVVGLLLDSGRAERFVLFDHVAHARAPGRCRLVPALPSPRGGPGCRHQLRALPSRHVRGHRHLRPR